MDRAIENKSSSADGWASRLRDFIPGYVKDCPALGAVAPRPSFMLHGSITLGIDDPFTDLDVWVLVPEACLAQADALSASRFFEFKLDGKPGHFNLESREECAERVAHCDMERIAEVRRAIVIAERDGFAQRLIQLARRPMPEPVRQAWFCYHYIEMRGEHRACDNPIERGQPLALLPALASTLNQALRAAMVLDGEPYPYIKWLAHAAARTPTGALVVATMQQILDLLATGALRHAGPEKQHPLGLKLREIRGLLTGAARTHGIDEPWLKSWWLYMTQAREQIRQARWLEDNA